MLLINNPEKPEGLIWILGRGRREPEEMIEKFTAELARLVMNKLHENKMFTQEQMGFEARIAVKGIPLHLDKENYRQDSFPWWGVVREPPTENDTGPFVGLGTMLSGKKQIWYSKRNWTWVLASPKEMAEYSYNYLLKFGLINV